MGVWRHMAKSTWTSIKRAVPRELAWWVPSRRSRSERVREALGGIGVVGLGVVLPVVVAFRPTLPTLVGALFVLLIVPPLVMFFSYVPQEFLGPETPVTDAGRTLGRSWVQVGAKTWFVDGDGLSRPTRPSGLHTDLDGFVLPVHAHRARWPSAMRGIGRATELVFRGMYIGCVLAIGGGLTLEIVRALWDGSFGSFMVVGTMGILFLSIGAAAGLVIATLLQFVLHKCWYVVARRIDRWRRQVGPVTRVELQGRVLVVGDEGSTRFHLDEPGRSVRLDRDAHRLELRNDREQVVLHGELGALDFLVEQVEQVRPRADDDARAAIPQTLQALGMPD